MFRGFESQMLHNAMLITRLESLTLHFNSSRTMDDFTSEIGSHRRCKENIGSSDLNRHPRSLQRRFLNSKALNSTGWAALSGWLKRYPTMHASMISATKKLGYIHYTRRDPSKVWSLLLSERTGKCCNGKRSGRPTKDYPHTQRLSRS